MRLTGIAVLTLGVLIALYCLGTLFPLGLPGGTTGATPAGAAAADDTSGSKPIPIAYILAPFSLAAISIGGWMLYTHQRGVIRTKNLTVRN